MANRVPSQYLEYIFPKGAKDDGACALFAAWNSFYDSEYVKLAEPVSDNVSRQLFGSWWAAAGQFQGSCRTAVSTCMDAAGQLLGSCKEAAEAAESELYYRAEASAFFVL